MNDEQLIISALLNGAVLKDLHTKGITSKDFFAYKDELQFIERNTLVPSKQIFRSKFPGFKVKKVSKDDLPVLISEFKDRKFRSRIGNLLSEVIDKLDTMSPDQIAQKLHEDTKKLLYFNSNATAHDIISNWQSLYEGVKERKKLRLEGKFVGIPTSIPSIDRVMNGLMPGELIIVLGFMKEGKSWLLIDFAVSALVNKKRVLYVSLEMPKERVGYRVHTMLSAATTGRKEDIFPNMAIENGSVNTKKYRKFLREAARNYDQGFHIVDRKISSIKELPAIVEEVKPDIVFWDYLGLNLSTNGKANWEAVADESNAAKSIAMNYNIPFVLAAQANRGGGTDRDATPTLVNFAKAIAAGQDADRIISIRLNKGKELLMSLAGSRYGPGVDIACDWDINLGIIREKKMKLKRGKSE